MATLAQTPTTHIRLDDKGVAWIDDTNVKVIEVALDHSAYDWSAEEIHRQHYRSLSLAQIHAALSYYYDHQAVIDKQIDQQVAEVERMRDQSDSRTNLLTLAGTWSPQDAKEFESATAHLEQIDPEHWK